MLGARTFLSTKLASAWQRRLRPLWSQAQELLFPPACVLCGQPGEEGQLLCTGCAPEWPLIDLAQACPRCGKPETGGQVCGSCQTHPPAWDRAFVPFPYAPPVDDLLRQFKFHNRLAAGRLLSQRWLAAFSAQQDIEARPLPDCVIPVPLHPKRIRERGYNQSLELLRTLAPQLGVRIEHKPAQRVRATSAQMGLSAKDRQHNLDGAFVINAPLPRHIALFDDVITTGSTLAELSKIARAAGAEVIEVWAIARTAKH
ncbi:MAG: ComF family protein [Gammaproteobacteria bacterium]